MENAYQPELWQNVYVVLGSSSAALIGLLFIATSLHLDEIINNLGLRRRAFNNTRYLLMIFVEALLIPCLSGFLPIRLPGESTRHYRVSRKWVLMHAPRDPGQS